jgi:hypothetical protein
MLKIIFSMFLQAILIIVEVLYYLQCAERSFARCHFVRFYGGLHDPLPVAAGSGQVRQLAPQPSKKLPDNLRI